MIKVKICGLTTAEAVEAATLHGANYAGFVFFPPSPRNLTYDAAEILARPIPSGIQKVAVLVDPDDGMLKSLLEVFPADILQLHGKETPTRLMEIKRLTKLPVIKAFQVQKRDDILAANDYNEVADMFLFDASAPSSDLPGGNGVSFDWTWLANARLTKPWFLSGGLNADNVLDAILRSGANMVDISSNLESRPGIKDPARVAEFLDVVYKAYAI